jgi:hypothetical protein
LICRSFFVLIYYQPQATSIGKSINAAGKNRHLTSNSLFQSEKFLDGSSNVLTVKTSLNNLEANIGALKYGGSISGAYLQSLSPVFSPYLNNLSADFSISKTLTRDKIISPPQSTQIERPGTL